MKGYRTVPFSKLTTIVNLSEYSWNDIEQNLTTIKSGIRRGEIKLNFPIKLDTKLGSIIGHILGDGSIDKHRQAVFYSNSNKELLKEFISYMNAIFGIWPRIWIQKRKSNFDEKSKWLRRLSNLDEVPNKHPVGLFYPKICTVVLHGIFGKFAEGQNKRITKQIKHSNLEVKKGLIRAFFDDEGSIRSDNRTARFHQDNKEILKDIKIIIGESNINTNPIRSYMKRNKARHYFTLTGFRNYFRFYHLIKCTSSKKRREFELLIEKVKNSKQFKKKYAL